MCMCIHKYFLVFCACARAFGLRVRACACLIAAPLITVFYFQADKHRVILSEYYLSTAFSAYTFNLSPLRMLDVKDGMLCLRLQRSIDFRALRKALMARGVKKTRAADEDADIEPPAVLATPLAGRNNNNSIKRTFSTSSGGAGANDMPSVKRAKSPLSDMDTD